MTEISMKHLRYFKSLTHHRHFGQAAEACSISQPALSLQIKELEEILGTPLVERGARKIHLTSLGEAIMPRIEAIILAVDELKDLARASTSPLLGRLRIGVIPTIAPYFLPAAIRELKKDHPKLDLQPREAITQKLVDDLMEGKLDVAIVALPISNPSLNEITLFDEEFVLVRPKKDEKKPIPNIEKIQGMKLLLLEEGHCFREQALSFCKISPPRELSTIEGNSLSTLVQMVGADLGVTLIPAMAIPLEMRSASVSIARLPIPRPSRTIGMVWRKTNPLSEQLAHIAKILSQLNTKAILRK